MIISIGKYLKESNTFQYKNPRKKLEIEGHLFNLIKFT